MWLAPSWLTPELPAQWQPNFSHALPLLLGHLLWLFALCLTLPSPSTSLKLLRLASLPVLIRSLLRLSFDLSITLGNPLRDAAVPTITWALMVKAFEICFTSTYPVLFEPDKAGGPRWIRPFRAGANHDGDDCGKATRGPLRVGEDESVLEWRPVPYPRWLSSGRLVYALDVLTLKRPGTSLLFPRERRALEWSLDDLNAWSSYLRRTKTKPSAVPPFSHVHRFGQAEASVGTAALQFLFVYLGMGWIYLLASPSSKTICAAGLILPVPKHAATALPRAAPWLFERCKSPVELASFFAIPLPSQLLTVAIFGAFVCLMPALPEAILFKFWSPKTATTYLPAFDRPLASASISRLWAQGWHLFHSRDFVLLSRLLPFGHTRAGKLVGSFLSSAAFHVGSVALSLYDRGMYIFFLSQAAGILIERQVLDLVKTTSFAKRNPRAIRAARRAWLFIVLFLPGRFFVDAVLSKGLMTKGIMEGFSPRALYRMVRGELY